MNKDFIVVNNFYSDPHAVRKRALSLAPYNFISDIPGQRSVGLDLDQSSIMKSRFEELLGAPITRWDTFTGKLGNKEKMNGCFQLITEGDKSWVHHDSSGWAAVVYLTPNGNPDAGTGLFTHIETGISEWDPCDIATDLNLHPDRFYPEKWRCNLEVKYQFNRMILYRGALYHRSMIN